MANPSATCARVPPYPLSYIVILFSKYRAHPMFSKLVSGFNDDSGKLKIFIAGNCKSFQDQLKDINLRHNSKDEQSCDQYK